MTSAGRVRSEACEACGSNLHEPMTMGCPDERHPAPETGRVLSRWTWANWDKPHRCPKCHGIQYDSDNPVMRCDRCHLRWSRSQARLRLNWYRWTGR